jgi:hypothetical protein
MILTWFAAAVFLPGPPSEPSTAPKGAADSIPSADVPKVKEELIQRLEKLERVRRGASFRVESVWHVVSQPPTAWETHFNGDGDSYWLKSFDGGGVSITARNPDYSFYHRQRQPPSRLVDRYFKAAPGVEPEDLTIQTHYWFPDGAHFVSPILPLLKHSRLEIVAILRERDSRTLVFHLPDGPTYRGVRLEAGSLTFDDRTGGMIRSDVIVQYGDGPSRERSELRYRRDPILGLVPERREEISFNALTGMEITRKVRTWHSHAPGRPNDPEFRLSGIGLREP